MTTLSFRLRYHLFSYFIVLYLLFYIPYAKAEKLNDQIVGTVNGNKITAAQLKAEINRIIPLTTYHSKMSLERKSEFTKTALNNLILNELKYQRAKKLNFKIDKNIIKREVKATMKRFKSKREFKKVLKANGITLDDLRRLIEKSLLIKKIDEEEDKKKIVVTDDDIKEYYAKNKKKFVMPEQRRIRVILLRVDPSARRSEWIKTKERIKVLLERIKAGEDFGEIAKKYSDDSSRQNSGELGWLHSGQLLTELNGIAFNLSKGEVSPIIESLYGYHLLKVLDIKPSKQMKLEELKMERLKAELKRKLARERKEAWIANLKSGADIKILIENY